MGGKSDAQQSHDMTKEEANPAFAADLYMVFIQLWLQEEEWEKGGLFGLVVLRRDLTQQWEDLRLIFVISVVFCFGSQSWGQFWVPTSSSAEWVSLDGWSLSSRLSRQPRSLVGFFFGSLFLWENIKMIWTPSAFEGDLEIHIQHCKNVYIHLHVL